MIIKTLQWNIGGGRYRNSVADPLGDNYIQDNIEYFINYIKQQNPDIITLQESHSNDEYSFAKTIVENTDLKYCVDFPLSESHIDSQFQLGISIISKYPLANIQKELFTNPNYTMEWKGQKVLSHDKGVLKAEVKLGNSKLNIETTHLIPFRKYNVDLKDQKLNDLKLDVEQKLINTESENLLIQGDFNINSKLLIDYFPKLISNGVVEIPIESPTSPRGRSYDHVIYKGLELLDYKIDSNVLTDHYSLISTFKLEQH